MALTYQAYDWQVVRLLMEAGADASVLNRCHRSVAAAAFGILVLRVL